MLDTSYIAETSVGMRERAEQLVALVDEVDVLSKESQRLYRIYREADERRVAAANALRRIQEAQLREFQVRRYLRAHPEPRGIWERETDAAGQTVREVFDDGYVRGVVTIECRGDRQPTWTVKAYLTPRAPCGHEWLRAKVSYREVTRTENRLGALIERAKALVEEAIARQHREQPYAAWAGVDGRDDAACDLLDLFDLRVTISRGHFYCPNQGAQDALLTTVVFRGTDTRVWPVPGRESPDPRRSGDCPAEFRPQPVAPEQAEAALAKYLADLTPARRREIVLLGIEQRWARS